MKKKIVSGVMALSLVFCSAAALPEGAVTDLLGSGITASADDELTSGFWRFTKDKDNYAYVTGYTGFDEKITIPATLEGYSVVGISSSAFEKNQNLSEVVIPSNVTYIGYAAFSGSSITKITIPATVTTFGSSWGSFNTFNGCTKLKSVTYNSGVEIGEKMFNGCTSLETVTLGSKVKKLGASAFYDCSALKSININNITYIESGAFQNNTSLSSVTFNSGLTYLGYKAFANSGLTSVTVPAKVTYGTSWGDANTFSDCTKLTKATVNSTVIPVNAFRNCKVLKTVKIGSAIRSIGDSAFYDDEKLTTVTNAGDPVYLGSNAFTNCTSLKTINLGSKLVTFGYGVFSNDTSLTTMRIPATVTNFGTSWGNSYAFSGCTNLKNVYIANSPVPEKCGMFHDCTKVVINTIKDSPAYKYAVDNAMSKKTFAAKPAKSLSFNSKNYTIVVDETLTLFPTIAPVNSTDMITYVSGDESVATVSEYGKVTAKKTGPVQIQASTSSGKKAVCTINVVASGTTSKDTPKKKSVKPVSVSLTTQTYTGKALKPSPTVLLNPCTQLVKGVDYTVSYKNNKKVGKATITITGKGNYTGSVSKTFSINPKSTSVSKLTNQKGKKAKVTYKKVAGVTGYQVTYSTSKKFTKSTTKNVNVKGAAKTSKVLKKLKKNKTYYVKVRSYQKVSGMTYYSTYSKVKKVKIKK